MSVRVARPAYGYAPPARARASLAAWAPRHDAVDGRALWWILRVGAFLCFVGHGAFGVVTKEAWLPFFALAGIGRDAAFQLMPVVGACDIAIGTLALLRPRAALLAYMVVWTVWTAALRPLTGMPVWEMLERAGNYGVPLAMLVAAAWPPRRASSGSAAGRWLAPLAPPSLAPSDLRNLRRVLSIAAALLLVGHAMLSLQQKGELVAHYALLAPGHGAALAVASGWIELALAAAVLGRPSIALGVAVCGWKLATEALFVPAGAPFWEVVERGGSYAVPLALALTMWYARAALTPRAA